MLVSNMIADALVLQCNGPLISQSSLHNFFAPHYCVIYDKSHGIILSAASLEMPFDVNDKNVNSKA